MANKALAAVAAVLLLAGAGWLAFRPALVSPPALPPVVAKTASPSHRPIQNPSQSSISPESAMEDVLPPPVDLARCDRDLDLHGTVVDTEGKAVSGARIQALAFPGRRTFVLNREDYFRAVDGPKTRSSSDGTFSIRLRRGDLVDLRVDASGTAETIVPQCQAGERVRVVLEPGAKLEVAVKDDHGRAVENAVVNLRVYSVLFGLRLDRKLITDSSGMAVLALLPSGKAGLEVEHPRYATVSRRIEIPGGGILPVPIELTEGKTVEGRVVDATTGKAVTGATVGIAWPMDKSVKTGPDGSFTLYGWSAQPGTDLHAVAMGYGRAMLPGPFDGPVTISLSPGDTVRGRLVTGDGTPVAQAMLAAVASRRDGQRQELDAVSGTAGPDGRFLLTDLRHDLPHSLVIQAVGYGRSVVRFPPPAASPGGTDLGDITLAPGTLIDGVVHDSSGKPLPEVRVSLSGPLDKDAVKNGFDTYYGYREDRRTDDLGRFRFPDEAPGEFEVTARISGAPELSRKVRLAAGSGTVRVELVPEATGAKPLSVLVVDSHSVPIAGAFVTVDTHTGSNAEQRTGSDGVAHFESLTGDSVQVSVMDDPSRASPRFLGDFKSVPLGALPEFRFVVEDAAVIKGVVLDTEGKPVPQVFVFAKRADGRTLSFIQPTDAEGRFKLTAPPNEPLDLMLPDNQSGDARTPLRGEVKGVRAPAEGIVIQARRISTSKTLTVVIQDETGEAVQDAAIQLIGGGRPSGKLVDTTGRAVFDGLAEDTVSLIVQRNFRALVPSRAWEGSVPPPQTKVVPNDQEVVLRFRKGRPRAVQVLDSAGNSAKSASVAASWADWTNAWYTTDADGRTSLPVPTDTSLKVLQAELHRTDGTVERKAIESLPSGDEEIVLRLEPSKGR